MCGVCVPVPDCFLRLNIDTQPCFPGVETPTILLAIVLRATRTFVVTTATKWVISQKTVPSRPECHEGSQMASNKMSPER